MRERSVNGGRPSFIGEIEGGRSVWGDWGGLWARAEGEEGTEQAAGGVGEEVAEVIAAAAGGEGLMVFVAGTDEEGEGDAGEGDGGGFPGGAVEDKEAGEAEAAGGEIDEVFEFVGVIEGGADGWQTARGEPPEECEPAADGDGPEGGLMPELAEHERAIP